MMTFSNPASIRCALVWRHPLGAIQRANSYRLKRIARRAHLLYMLFLGGSLSSILNRNIPLSKDYETHNKQAKVDPHEDKHVTEKVIEVSRPEKLCGVIVEPMRARMQLVYK